MKFYTYITVISKTEKDKNIEKFKKYILLSGMKYEILYSNFHLIDDNDGKIKEFHIHFRVKIFYDTKNTKHLEHINYLRKWFYGTLL